MFLQHKEPLQVVGLLFGETLCSQSEVPYLPLRDPLARSEAEVGSHFSVTTLGVHKTRRVKVSRAPLVSLSTPRSCLGAFPHVVILVCLKKANRGFSPRNQQEFQRIFLFGFSKWSLRTPILA